MLNRIVFISLTMALELACLDSSFADPMIRAPVDCNDAPSCGYDIDIASIKKEESEALKEIERCKIKVHTSPYLDDAEKKDSCRLVDAAYNSWCSKQDPDYFLWVDPNSINRGEETLRELKNRLSSGDVTRGTQVIITPTSTVDEQHIAVCDVRKIKGSIGPPLNCRTVAIVTPNKSWIRALLESPFQVCPMSASFRMSGSVNIDFSIKTSKGVEPFVNSITQMMSDVLGLTVEIAMNKQPDGEIYSANIYSTAPLRNSIILVGGWREALDFDVHLTKWNDSVDIRGVARALVSRQAVGSMTSYQGLDDGQKGAYAQKLDNSVKAAIKSVCSPFKEVDSKNLVCP